MEGVNYTMNENMKSVILNRINRTAEALKRNNMEFHYAESKVEVLTIISNLLKTGDMVATGGSVTLEECGVISLLRSDKYKYLDRDAIDPDKVDSFTAQHSMQMRILQVQTQLLKTASFSMLTEEETVWLPFHTDQSQLSWLLATTRL